MAELRVCRGLPGSGKSTWAKEVVKQNLGSTVRVNRDLLRIMLHNNEYAGQTTEKSVVSARDIMIAKFLGMGLNVICDDTNLDRKVLLTLARLAYKNGAGFEVIDFDTPVEVCIERDSKREATVGEKVIRGMHSRFFIKNKFPEDPTQSSVETVFEAYEPNLLLPRGVIVDLDGTCALHERSPYDYTKVSTDNPNWNITELVEDLYVRGYWIVFVSGRPDSCERDTRDWIDRYIEIPNYDLFMRKTGDDRNDSIIWLLMTGRE